MAWGMLEHLENSNIIHPVDNWTTISNEPPHIVNMSTIPINALMTSRNLAYSELKLVNEGNDHLTLTLEQEKD